MSDIKKMTNNENVIFYNNDLEQLLAQSAEECESLGILHLASYEKYNKLSNIINIPVIILSSGIGFITGIDSLTKLTGCIIQSARSRATKNCHRWERTVLALGARLGASPGATDLRGGSRAPPPAAQKASPHGQRVGWVQYAHVVCARHGAHDPFLMFRPLGHFGSAMRRRPA